MLSSEPVHTDWLYVGNSLWNTVSADAIVTYQLAALVGKASAVNVTGSGVNLPGPWYNTFHPMIMVSWQKMRWQGEGSPVDLLRYNVHLVDFNSSTGTNSSSFSFHAGLMQLDQK